MTTDAVSRYSRELYDVMRKLAKTETVEGHEVLIYRGAVTKLWNQIGASNAYYSRVMRNLTDLGCIHQVQRGSSGADTIIALLRRPGPNEKSDLTSGRPSAMLALRQEIDGLKQNVGGIDIAEVIGSLDRRLSTLEREVKKFAKVKEPTSKSN